MSPASPWRDVVRREAREETGAWAIIVPAKNCWYLDACGRMRRAAVRAHPRPLALFAMRHPPGTPRAGALYRLVIYRARLRGPMDHLPPDEVAGLIELTPAQLARGRLRLREVVTGGGRVVTGARHLSGDTCLYPIGTARVLSELAARGVWPPLGRGRSRRHTLLDTKWSQSQQ